MAYRKDFPGLLVSDASDFDQDARNAPFGSDAGSQPTAVMPLAMLSHPAMPQMTGQALTWAQGNVAPWLGNIFNATGLSSQPVQNAVSQMATPFRDAGNWLSPGLGNNVWPQTSTGDDYSANPGTSTDTPYRIHNPLLDVPMQVVMPKILTDATQVNMPYVLPTQARKKNVFDGIKNADSMSRHGTYTQDEANNITNLEKNGVNTSYINVPPMSDTDKGSVIKYSNAAQLDPNMMFKFIAMESGGNPNAVSPNGAIGDFQIVGSTAGKLGVTDRFNPDQNIMGGIYLAKQNADALSKTNLPISAENLYMMHQLGAYYGGEVIRGAQEGKKISELSEGAQDGINWNYGSNNKTAADYVNANKQLLDARYKNFLKQNPNLD
jgi:hypothetical protein